jgi:hypothetical protein
MVEVAPQVFQVQTVQAAHPLLHQEHLVPLDQVVLQVQTVFLVLQVQQMVLQVLLEHRVLVEQMVPQVQTVLHQV